MPTVIMIIELKIMPKNKTNTAKRAVLSKNTEFLKNSGQEEVHAAQYAPFILLLEKQARSLNIAYPSSVVFE